MDAVTRSVSTLDAYEPGPSRAVVLTAAAGPILLASGWVVIIYLPSAPLWNAGLRLLPAGLMLFAACPAVPRGAWWTRSVVLGGLNFGAFFTCQAVAVHRIPVGVAVTIAAMQALVIPLCASVAGERLRLSQLGHATIGVVGVALLVMQGSQRFDLAGVASAAGTALCTASGFLLTRRWGLPIGVHHTTVTAWQLLTGAALLVPAAIVFDGAPPDMSPSQIGITVWLTVGGTAVPFWIIFGALHAGLSAVALSRLVLLCPLVATALGWLFARQTLTGLQILGAALVLVPVAATCSNSERSDRDRSEVTRHA